MANANLSSAKKAKNDEFYTQYCDIEREVNAYLEFDADVFRGKTIFLPCDDPKWSNFTRYFVQNFKHFGLKKLISTCYAGVDNEIEQYTTNGKIFILDGDTNNDGKIDINDLECLYLKGDGDFRSEEIKQYRDEADFIITNPPFSLFREFLAWIVEGDKKFLIIGNMNAITYKETFPLIKNNKLWLGVTNFNKGMYFKVPADFIYADSYNFEKEQNGERVSRVPGVCWFTNIDHGRRHQPLSLMTMTDNIKFSKHKEIKNIGYAKYDNYDAIEIPYTDAIPSDYEEVMGVPITFLDKYNPEQFEIIKFRKGNDDKDLSINDKCPYFRILIKHKQNK